MSVVVTVLSIFLAVAFLAAGVAKLMGVEVLRKSAEHLGLPFSTFRVIGVLEVAGTAGLIAGFWYWPLAVAAAIGLGTLMIGAVYYHRKAKDAVGETAPAAALAVLSFIAAALVPLAA